MKSEHRHELKTNELAEWLGNLPQWTKENRTTIIVVLAVVVAAAAFYVRYRYRESAVAQEQLEFTNLLNQLLANKEKVQVFSAQAPGSDFSFMLLQPAESLGNFAQSANNDRMAALALIKQAEALRTELHYRPGTVSEQDVTGQINRAKAAYTEAKTRLRWAPSASLMAAAEFGLGLCEEELSNFEKAQQIYKDNAANPDFEGAVAVAQAKHRLETMADYKQKVIFKPSPTPPAVSLLQSQTTGAATEPTIQIKPVDTNLPAEVILPIDVNQASQTPNVLPDVNSKVPDPNVSVK